MNRKDMLYGILAIVSFVGGLLISRWEYSGIPFFVLCCVLAFCWGYCVSRMESL